MSILKFNQNIDNINTLTFTPSNYTVFLGNIYIFEQPLTLKKIFTYSSIAYLINYQRKNLNFIQLLLLL